MTVARILAMKGSDVHTLTPRHTLQEAAMELAHRKIGALVVVNDDGAVVGLVGERDIVDAIARRGPDVLREPIAQHMKKNVKFVSEGDSIGEASETMTIERHRHLPVLRDGKLVGLISIGDVVKHRIEACEAEHLALRQYIASA